MVTTIQIQDPTWIELNKRKKRGESFDSVIKRALYEIPELSNKVSLRARKRLRTPNKKEDEHKRV